MSPESPGEWYSYAVVRVVPRVEREEFINTGIVVFIRSRRTVCARIDLDEDRLQHFAPDADIRAIRTHLELFNAICQATPDGGPISELPADERFHWLTAPRSTVVQVSPVHEGCTRNLEQTLDELFRRYVA